MVYGRLSYRVCTQRLDAHFKIQRNAYHLNKSRLRIRQKKIIEVKRNFVQEHLRNLYFSSAGRRKNYSFANYLSKIQTIRGGRFTALFLSILDQFSRKPPGAVFQDCTMRFRIVIFLQPRRRPWSMIFDDWKWFETPSSSVRAPREMQYRKVWTVIANSQSATEIESRPAIIRTIARTIAATTVDSTRAKVGRLRRGSEMVAR